MSIMISQLWLQEYLKQTIDLNLLPEQLTNAGLEVEGIQPGSTLSEHFVVGAIISVKKHPNAEKLNLCQVDVGSEILEIVCGCASVRTGANAIVAKIGAVLPNGMEIKATKLRGEPSNGMLCSFSELGLVKESKGIILFEDEIAPGTFANEVLEPTDALLDISLTPDRGDCFSIAGIAREALALQYDKSLPRATTAVTLTNFTEVAKKFPETTQYLLISIKQANKCSPLLWQRRLVAAGYQSQNFWVDFTQYYMHATGQPMHAFDADKLQGMPHVRYANAGEKLTVLGGKELILTSEILIIADDHNPIAIAGLIGGEATAVTTDTKNVMLEIANFNKQVIARSSQLLNLHTAASDRFARGVDPLALFQCLDIIQAEFNGYAASYGYIHSQESRAMVTVSSTHIRQVLGADVDLFTMLKPLTNLGFEISEQTTESKQAASVSVPSFRTDIKSAIEVIEEALRLHGHQDWPCSEYARIASQSNRKFTGANLLESLAAYGFQEMITYSFIDPKLLKHSDYTVKTLSNPMSADMSVMRPSLLFGLLERLAYNQKRQISSARVFEIGRVFAEDGSETNNLAAVVFGDPKKSWPKITSFDFYALKGMLESILKDRAKLQFKPDSSYKTMHPHACAAIYIANVKIGYIGLVHPKIQAQFGLKNVIAFELNYDLIDHGPVQHKYKAISKYPTSTKDLSFFADAKVTYASILAEIEQLSIKDLVKVQLFDIYQSDKISYTIAFTFNSFTETLSDNEILAHLALIVKTLENNLQLQLRGEL